MPLYLPIIWHITFSSYRAEVLFAKGDPIAPGIADFLNDGTDVDFDQRSGDEHDGMWFFGASDDGKTLHENGVTDAA